VGLTTSSLGPEEDRRGSGVREGTEAREEARRGSEAQEDAGKESEDREEDGMGNENREGTVVDGRADPEEPMKAME
jgi:hypothetical protein